MRDLVWPRGIHWQDLMQKAGFCTVTWGKFNITQTPWTRWPPNNHWLSTTRDEVWMSRKYICVLDSMMEDFSSEVRRCEANFPSLSIHKSNPAEPPQTRWPQTNIDYLQLHLWWYGRARKTLYMFWVRSWAIWGNFYCPWYNSYKSNPAKPTWTKCPNNHWKSSTRNFKRWL